jgi:hypothetical protein
MFSSTEFAVEDDGDYNYFNGCHNNYIKICSLQIGSFCFFSIPIFQMKKYNSVHYLVYPDAHRAT